MRESFFKPAFRALVLAVVVLVFGGAAVYAQTAPSPQPPATAVTTSDPDKKMVQDRWGNPTGAPSANAAKKGKPGGTPPAKSPGAPQ